MKAYVVGGAVRDALLGVPVNDRDWVVVGATPEAMIAAGFRPVGRDFPVFLHPTSGEQYALARTERKSAAGYHGFVFHAAPDVTLEQDLARRDLTINAIAQDPDTGALIDPFGGRTDLSAKVFRHVSPAFAEDPVRLLRVARFGARWPDFGIAPETAALLRRLVDDGEVDALVAERVWQELSRGLMERMPSRMLQILHDCGALARLAPELAALHAGAGDAWPHTLRALDLAAAGGLALPGRFACLVHRLDGAGDAPAALLGLCERWRVDNDCRELGLLLLRELASLRVAHRIDAEASLMLIERCDALRRPERFESLLRAAGIVARVAGEERAAAAAPRLLAALAAARAVDVAALRQRRLLDDDASGPAIGQALHTARARAIAEAYART